MNDAVLVLIAGRAVANVEGYIAKRLKRSELISRNADVMADLARHAMLNRHTDLHEIVHMLCSVTARWAFAGDAFKRDAFNRVALELVSLVRRLSVSKRKRAA